MAKCTSVSGPRDLTALAEGTLSAEGMERLKAHLAECSSCRVVHSLMKPKLPLGTIVAAVDSHLAARKRDCLANAERYARSLRAQLVKLEAAIVAQDLPVIAWLLAPYEPAEAARIDELHAMLHLREGMR